MMRAWGGRATGNRIGTEWTRRETEYGNGGAESEREDEPRVAGATYY